MAEQFTELKPKVVLGIAAHPDDLDFGVGGTIAKYAQDGASIHYLILTDGSKGSADRSLSTDEIIQTRQAEQRAALDVLGGGAVTFLDYVDGELEVNMKLKRDIVKVIRSVKPDVVITWDPSVIYAAKQGFINHPDHRASGQAALDAVFPLARDHLSFPELCNEGYEPHKTPTVLLITFDKGNYCVDISETLETKFAAIAAHVSQAPGVEHVRERFTELAREAGQSLGCTYAESFTRIDIQA